MINITADRRNYLDVCILIDRNIIIINILFCMVVKKIAMIKKN